MVDTTPAPRGRPAAGSSPAPEVPLSAPRREFFACFAARLGTLTDAYLSAGYTCASRSVASRNASRLRAREPGVRERIEHLSRLSDEQFEQAFAAAHRRVKALDEAQSGGTEDAATAPCFAEVEVPMPAEELMGMRETLEYVVRNARLLHQKACSFGLPPNTKRCCLAVHGAATHRLLSSLPKLDRADGLTAEVRQNERDAEQAPVIDLRRALRALRELPPCACGSG